jgi:DNA repair exonuclease SbcCD ATPase subunit
MLTFTRLNIQGFCSIDSFSLQLNQDCTVLIKAPNGFGKSTLLNALVWALYGKNIKGVSEVNTWKELFLRNYNFYSTIIVINSIISRPIWN